MRVSVWLMMTGIASLCGLARAADSESGPQFSASGGGILSNSVVVPPNCSTVYLAGVAAWSPGGAPREDYGSTEEQTAKTIENIQAELKKLNLTLSDIVMMRSFLAQDPDHGNRADFEGYSRAYKRYFGGLAHKPARTTVEIPRLVVDGLKVEMEAVAALCHRARK